MGDGPGSQCRKELHEMDGEQGWILRKEREVRPGVPAMVQWVKNLTAVARVAAGASSIPSLVQWVKESGVATAVL